VPDELSRRSSKMNSVLSGESATCGSVNLGMYILLVTLVSTSVPGPELSVSSISCLWVAWAVCVPMAP